LAATNVITALANLPWALVGETMDDDAAADGAVDAAVDDVDVEEDEDEDEDDADVDAEPVPLFRFLLAVFAPPSACARSNARSSASFFFSISSRDISSPSLALSGKMMQPSVLPFLDGLANPSTMLLFVLLLLSFAWSWTLDSLISAFFRLEPIAAAVSLPCCSLPAVPDVGLAESATFVADVFA